MKAFGTIFIFLRIVSISSILDSLFLGDLIYLVPNDQANIEFGYSLAFYINNTHKSILVGAPSSNTSQLGVISPGALYICDLAKQTSVIECTQVEVDNRDAADKYVPFIDQDLKDFQRLGGSLVSRGDQVLVCAPNWHYYERRIKQTIDAPVGICFRSSSLDTFTPFSVPYDITQGKTIDYLNYASCQSGFSSALTKDLDVVLGSPGCFNWEGESFAETNSKYVSFGKGFPPDVFGGASAGGTIWLSNMYMGYSVAEGSFGGQNGIAAGMPRAAQVAGRDTENNRNSFVANPMVTIHLISQEKLVLWTSLSPPRNDVGLFDSVWLFSYFGYSIAVADVDGNGLDDVIIGAPFYRNETNFDQGAILVYMQYKEAKEGHEDKYYMLLEGEKRLRVGTLDYGRFGSCVTNANDLDGDGISDIAVGAPYSEYGRVYIYLGTPNGLSDTPYQIIQSSDESLSTRALRGFGFSFAAVNADSSSSQSDLAVGAFASDTVVLFRSKVMIDLDWNVKFPQKMDLNSKCFVGGKEFPCAKIVTCLSYSYLRHGKKGDRGPQDFNLIYNLDTDSFPKRLFFDDFGTFRTQHIEVRFEKVTCYTDLVYTNRDLNNLEAFAISTNVEHIPYKFEESRLQTEEVTSSKDFLEIHFECKFSNVSACIADLHLETKAEPETVQAEDVKFDMFFIIKNFGEPSYSNTLKLEMDPFLELSGKAEIDQTSTIFPVVDCRALTDGLVQCSLGTFINANDVLRLKLNFVTKEDFLLLKNLREHDVKFEIKSSLETLSDIKFPGASKAINYVAIEAQPEIYLTKSESSTDLVSLKEDFVYEYPEDTNDPDSIGPPLAHVYEIYNKMMYAIENNILEIYWPYKFNDKDLLDGEVTITSSNADCTTSMRKGFVDDETKNISSFGDVIWKLTSCHLALLEPQTSVQVILSLRLAMKTVMEDIYTPDFDEIKSYAKLVSSPTLVGLKLRRMETNHILTRIDYGDLQFKVVPKVFYILGALLGVVILAIIVCCLRKTNFFKRKTRDAIDAGEQEALEEHTEEDVQEEGEPMKMEQPQTTMMTKWMTCLLVGSVLLCTFSISTSAITIHPAVLRNFVGPFRVPHTGPILRSEIPFDWDDGPVGSRNDLEEVSQEMFLGPRQAAVKTRNVEEMESEKAIRSCRGSAPCRRNLDSTLNLLMRMMETGR